MAGLKDFLFDDPNQNTYYWCAEKIKPVISTNRHMETVAYLERWMEEQQQEATSMSSAKPAPVVATVPRQTAASAGSHCHFRCGIFSMVILVFLLLLIPFGYYSYQVLTLFYQQDSIDSWDMDYAGSYATMIEDGF